MCEYDFDNELSKLFNEHWKAERDLINKEIERLVSLGLSQKDSERFVRNKVVEFKDLNT